MEPRYVEGEKAAWGRISDILMLTHQLAEYNEYSMIDHNDLDRQRDRVNNEIGGLKGMCHQIMRRYGSDDLASLLIKKRKALGWLADAYEKNARVWDGFQEELRKEQGIELEPLKDNWNEWWRKMRMTNEEQRILRELIVYVIGNEEANRIIIN